MEHLQDLARAPQAGKRHMSLSLFLALYLMLLAFFITLISHSSFEPEKSARTIDSLNATFPAATSTSLGRFTGDAGVRVAEARAFLDVAQGMFEAAIPATRVTERASGRLLELTLPEEALFPPGVAEVRRPHLRLLDRIAAGMASAPPGYRYVMEIVTTSDYSGDVLPLGTGLAMERAGALARAVVERGAPPDAVVTGLVPGDAAVVRLTFRVVAAGPVGVEAGRPVVASDGEAE